MLDPFGWYIDPSSYRWFLTLLVQILFAASLLLLVVMILFKIIVERREARRALLRQRFAEEMEEFLAWRGAIPVPTGIEEVSACADIAADILKRCSHKDALRLQDALVETGIPQRLAGEVTGQRSWTRRYQALERLGFLKIPSLRPLYRRMAGDADIRIAAKAIWALSLVAEPDDLPFILGTVTRIETLSSKFTEYLCANAVTAIATSRGDGAVMETVQEIMEGDLPILIRRDLMESFGRIGFTPAVPLLLDAWRRSDDAPEIRVTVIRALGTMGSPAIGELLPNALADHDWRVRVVASNFAHLAAEKTLPLLEKLLTDRSYHVRLNAAATLARLGAAGREALHRALAGNDPYARDAARYHLTRWGLTP